MRLFHYTTASKLAKILASKEIRVATAFVAPPERPVAWFTFSPEWEGTATPGILDAVTAKLRSLTFDQLVSIETPARIEVSESSAPHTWSDFRKLARCPKKTFRVALEHCSKLDLWRVSFVPVRFDSWLAIEVFHNGQWRDALENAKRQDEGSDRD